MPLLYTDFVAACGSKEKAMDIVYAEFAKRSGGKLSTYEVWNVADIKASSLSTIITIASNAYDDNTVEAVESTTKSIADNSDFLGLKATIFLPDRPAWTVQNSKTSSTDSSNNNNNPSSGAGSSSNTVALAAGIGGGVGGAVLLAAIGTTVYCMKRKRSGVSTGRKLKAAGAGPATYQSQGSDFVKPASLQSVSISVDSSASSYDDVHSCKPAQSKHMATVDVDVAPAPPPVPAVSARV
eukprot:tig00001041_g6570.t1